MLEQKRRSRLVLVLALLLVLVTSIAFSGVSICGFTNLDDDRYVTQNPNVESGLTVESLKWAFNVGYSANWHPLTWVSHMVDCQIWGLKPGGHHATNLLLHVLNTVLLFLLLTRMTGSMWRSAFAAALFGVHPLHVESVAWVSERKDVLSTLFLILTIWAYVRYTECPGAKRYLPVVVLFALGLMAKPMLVTLPFVLTLLDIWPLRRLNLAKGKGEGWNWKILRDKMPLLGLTLVSCVLTWTAQQRGGAVAALEQFPVGVRIANAFAAYVGYIGKTFWPAKLAVFYPHPGYSLALGLVIGSVLLFLALSILAVGSLRHRSYLGVGWLWYVLTLMPVIGIVQVGWQSMADRYTYIPLIGVFIIIAWGIPDLLIRFSSPRLRVPASHTVTLSVVGIAVVIVLAMCTWKQVGYWKDNIALYTHTLAVTKDNPVAHTNLGLAYATDGRIDDAIVQYQEAIRIRPDYAKAHNNLAVMLYFKEDYLGAWEEVHLTEQYGLDPVPGFLQTLEQKMPEPQER